MNTIGCRYKYLNDPTNSGMYNNSYSCQYAGPSGGGRCGNFLSNVCDVATNVCGAVTGASYTTSALCQTGLAPGANQWGFLQGSNAGAEDSLECRVYHAIASINTGNPVHCSHFGQTSPVCTGPVTPDAGHYCETLQYNCPAPNIQFAMKAQCLATAAGYYNAGVDLTSARSNADNSLGCREYHAQASRADNNTHCEHAGPSGAGVCGTRQSAWGNMLAAAPCLDNHVNVLFIAGVGSANVDLLIPPIAAGAVGKYTTTFDTAGNTQVCRIYHLGVASTNTAHCSHGFVSGGDNCGTLTANLCAFIESICTFGTNASYQYASSAACLSADTNSSNSVILAGVTGTAGSAADSFECRFYHAMVAASYTTGGANAAVAGAASLHQYHCGHTLRPATTGGCINAGSPTTAPPTPKSSSGSTLVISGAALVAFLFA